jgi:hypothetical protein
MYDETGYFQLLMRITKMKSGVTVNIENSENQSKINNGPKSAWYEYFFKTK